MGKFSKKQQHILLPPCHLECQRIGGQQHQQECDLRCAKDKPVENIKPVQSKKEKSSKNQKHILLPPCRLECQRVGDQHRKQECDLRCAEDKPVDYIGPDHMVVKDPPDAWYKQTMCESASITMVYFALGATVMPIVWYCLSFKLYWSINLHILLFTLAYQLLTPVSFLMMHRLDGAGIWMKECEKRIHSFILRMVAFLFILIGTLTILHWNSVTSYNQFTVHTFTGIVAIIFTVLDVLTLFIPIGHERSAAVTIVRFFCIVAFLFSSATFISGVIKPSLLQWYPTRHMHVFLILFCLFFTAVVVFRPIKNFVTTPMFGVFKR